MQLPTIPKIDRLSRKHKITVAGVAAAAAVALTVTGLEATAGGSAVAAGDPTGFSVSTGDQVKSISPESGMASQKAMSDQATAQKKAAADAAAKKKAAADAVAKKKAADAAAAKKKAADEAAARAKEAANRSTKRVVIKKTAPVIKKTAPVAKKAAPVTKAAPVAKATTAAPAAVTYPNNLDGWIREARATLAAHNIPVPTYNGIYRNVIRESSGNPNAINLWDSNAAKGIPSKGLLQTIDPTFNAYHVSGTSWNVYNPVANIAAACNYAYHVYGGMDNVNSAY
ncbi:transglycosylase SLT domain-containing protein [Streptomyces sp. NBC_00448]|uniref:transglycosylase SLT domain-containing protein n=1 Tax=Streptomyces sp. NBC_00448 TaxID=2903652 RepID=UPI002E1C14BF